jgi:hypothetical protein
MPLVLLIIYGLPLYSVSLLGLKVEPVGERDDQGRIVSIYYSEIGNVGANLFL